MNYHPFITPHAYTEIDGEKVSVAIDPVSEGIYRRNSEEKVIIMANISRIGRILCRKESDGY